MKPFLLSLALIFGAAASGGAQDARQIALAARIAANGAHEFEGVRHAAEVEGCVLWTYVWKPEGEDPEALWTVFRLEMQGLDFPKQKDGLRYIYIEKFGDRSATMVLFKMRPPFQARHEKPMFRNPKPPFDPSPREAPYHYVFQYKDSGFILHQGVEGPEKAAQFVEDVLDYKRRYCLVMG